MSLDSIRAQFTIDRYWALGNSFFCNENILIGHKNAIRTKEICKGGRQEGKMPSFTLMKLSTGRITNCYFLLFPIQFYRAYSSKDKILISSNQVSNSTLLKVLNIWTLSILLLSASFQVRNEHTPLTSGAPNSPLSSKVGLFSPYLWASLYLFLQHFYKVLISILVTSWREWELHWGSIPSIIERKHFPPGVTWQKMALCALCLLDPQVMESQC